IGVAVTTSTMGAKQLPRFVWNASESAPIGLYSLQPSPKLAVTDLAVVTPPEHWASFLAERGYLAQGVPLIKRVLALPGQIVCRTHLLITADRTEIGPARERARLGRALPVWQACRVIAGGEIFLMTEDKPMSLDSRSFGPIPASTIIGRA